MMNWAMWSTLTLIDFCSPEETKISGLPPGVAFTLGREVVQVCGRHTMATIKWSALAYNILVEESQSYLGQKAGPLLILGPILLTPVTKMSFLQFSAVSWVQRWPA